MSNKTSDKNVGSIEDDVNELKRLLYSDNLTQYGKRKLVNYYDKRIQELEAKLEFKEFGDLDNVEFEEYMSQFIPKQDVIEILNRHKLAYEEFNIMYNNTHYEDDEIRARDFYMIVTEDRIIQVLQELLGEEKNRNG